jgi:hypothetical protein
MPSVGVPLHVGSRPHLRCVRPFGARPAPVSASLGGLGLPVSARTLITRVADHGPAAYALTARATVALARTDVNPLVVMAGAATLGLLGVV